jgi:predicted aconitase with swiveling domain
LVFPQGKGSTVGSYALYRMKKQGTAPLAMINAECETIVAVGAIISEIPCVDKIDITQIKNGQKIKVNASAGKVIIE